MNNIDKEKYDQLLRKYNQLRSKCDNLSELNLTLQMANLELQKSINKLKGDRNAITNPSRVRPSNAEMSSLPQISPNRIHGDRSGLIG